MTIEAVQADEPLEAEVSPAALCVSFRHVGAVCILALDGVLCASSLAELEAHMDRLGRTPCRQVVLDMSRLTELDDAGSRVLTGLFHYVAARRGRLTVVAPNPAVRAMLAQTPLAAP